jgi:hypothetical protein
VSPQFEETAGKKFKRMPKAKASVSRNSKRPWQKQKPSPKHDPLQWEKR